MRRFLVIDRSSAAMALALGVTVWVVARLQEDPFSNRTLTIVSPLEVRGLDPQLEAAGPLDQQFTVTLRAPQSVLGQLDSNEVLAFVDAAGRGPGQYTLPVQLNFSGDGLAPRVVSQPLPTVTVFIDRRGERTLPVEVNLLGEPPPGYTIGSPTILPTEVLLVGPQNLIDRVAKVAVDLVVQDQRSTLEGEFEIIPRDQSGRPLEGLEVEPARVRVVLPIEAAVGFKELSVRVVTQGRVAPGYWISDIRATPDTVTVFGDPESVKELQGFLDTQPVDVEGAARTLIRQVGLVLPANLSLLDAEAVRVRIEVSAIEGGQTLQLPIVLEGLGEGLRASVSPRNVEVILKGPLPDLLGLRPEDVQVVVDLSGLRPGTHRLATRVVKPPSLEVQSVVPSQVEVVITSGSL
ncbi:MAG: hypothetical protein HYZ68_04190 [Chloroflexi bacterium]|nr:hypothetical protein [Chloroflexota bacterium]